jgi:hypothetical protein
VSEYQYYEFAAIDRPLNAAEQAAVRELSTRARITATSFVNEYHFGDFSGNPVTMMHRWYDAHLYYANWGSRRLMLRVPKSSFVTQDLQPYFVDGSVLITSNRSDLIIQLDDGFDDYGAVDGAWNEWDVEFSLGPVVGVRSELLAGDMRPLYLAWLAGIGRWEFDEDAFDVDVEDVLEPPVPPGLASLTGPQKELARFLRLSDDLLAEAATASGSRAAAGQEWAGWLRTLPADVKDAALVDLLNGDAAIAKTRLLAMRDHVGGPATGMRTIGELLDATAKRRAEREADERAERDRLQAEANRRAAEKRVAYLDNLARTQPTAWSKVADLIARKNAKAYDEAVNLLRDLREVGGDDFGHRFEALHLQHRNKPSFVDRLKVAGLLRL